MDGLTRIILLIVLLVLAAFFSLTESAFSYCNRIRMKVESDDNNRSAKLVLKYLDNFDRYIVTNLICSNVVILLFSVVSTMLFVDAMKEIGNNNPNEIGALVSTIVATIVIFYLGEIIPKAIGRTFPQKTSKICVYPIMVFDIILFPISFIFTMLVKLIKKIFHAPDNDGTIDEEDFQDIVDDIEDKGLIEPEESEIIQSAIEFDDTKVKQVMCPRDEIVALDINKKMNKDELIDYILDNQFSRFPVYEGSIDNIIGILHTQKLLKELMNNDNYDIRSLLMEPIMVSPNVHIDTIFEEFKKKRTHIAVVQDKDNKTLGIVTMEDVLEELIGDIDKNVKGGDEDE